MCHRHWFPHHTCFDAHISTSMIQRTCLHQNSLLIHLIIAKRRLSCILLLMLVADNIPSLQLPPLTGCSALKVKKGVELTKLKDMQRLSEHDDQLNKFE